ncbi:MAG: tryptophan--tRNA ligase [Candidatus Taylorbacteria bacterium]
MNEKSSKNRILTGMRPTGPLHLGHYVGALENWIKLQDKYDCYFLIADYQALGDYADNVSRIRDSVVQVVLDWLSVGLDPKKSTFVVQSYVPEYAELAMLLSMITPLGLVQGNPTLKNEMLKLSDVSIGFFNYPVSQVADILLNRANLVPVGEDQLPHIELTREIARKFNRLYGEVFPIPEALVGRIPRLVGTDGQAKMSKSLGNCVYLSDSQETVVSKVGKMFTDPTRAKISDPGHIEGNVVFSYLEVFHRDRVALDALKRRYKEGGVGDVEVKSILSKELNDFLDPIRERRDYFISHPDMVNKAIVEGSKKASLIAKSTMDKVRKAMNIVGYEDLRNIRDIV